MGGARRARANGRDRVCEVTADDVERLARLAGLAIDERDIGPVAAALGAHLAFCAPLLELDWTSAETARTLQLLPHD